MQLTLATLALVATVVSAQGVSQTLKPPGNPPAGCSTDYPSKFQIGYGLVKTGKRDIVKRAACDPNFLTVTLKGSVLTDAQGRIGSIVSNRQFQFDGPPAQAGAIYTGGWSVCNNGLVALGSSTVFYRCLSGNFYNLYDQPAGAACEKINFFAEPCGGSGSGVTQGPDGQPAVSQIPDGQAQAPTGAPKVSQISDGQAQAPSAAPKVSQISDGQPQAPTGAPKVSQISDGQPQAPTGTPKISQISDGQPQAPTGTPKISQISDGQPQAPTGTPKISQISDGQPQAPTGTPKISQISDGQPQAPTGTPKISQISDGQAQAPTGSPTQSPVPFTGGANVVAAGAPIMVAAVAVMAAVLL